MPRVSVVIPCYNHGKYVDEAVDSILNQTFADIEIIIVNDGSTDAFTNELLGSYHRPKTVVIHTENGGLPKARNTGIQNSSGEYILPLDADDKFERTFVEKAVRILDSSPDVGVVTCWIQRFGADNRLVRLRDSVLSDLVVENVCCGNSLFRRSCWESVGGYKAELTSGMEDWEFWISVTAQGWRVQSVPEPLFFYRIHALDSMLAALSRSGKRPGVVKRIVELHRAEYEAHVAEVICAKEALIDDLRLFSGFNTPDYRVGRAVLAPYRWLRQLWRRTPR